jgi:hypothetical protein
MDAADAMFITTAGSAFAALGTRGTVVDLDGKAPVRLLIPGNFATTAVRVRVRVSHDGATYYPLYDDAGNQKSIVVSTGRAVALDPAEFCGISYLQLRGTQATGTAAAQSTACRVTIITRLV